MKRMTGKVPELASKVQPGSVDGEGRKAGEIAAAERIVKRALQALLAKDPELAKIGKTDLRKAVVVWALKTQTTVSNDWIRERLCMSHASNVSNAARTFREGRNHGEAAHLQNRLMAAGVPKSKDPHEDPQEVDRPGRRLAAGRPPHPPPGLADLNSGGGSTPGGDLLRHPGICSSRP